ncbi:NYN domain-containing protein [Microbacterium sp.]|uniref:NYN domain-containing protein n=1 Tax=Microbacterium sp. TaxID=51671 RepID=UPI003C744069
MADKGVLLVDWDNLAGAVLGRGKKVDRDLVDALWRFARERMQGSPSAHMAATQFDPSIVAAMQEHFISSDPVRAAKEQADILLTVRAMDYLHQGAQRFILVTGDQDFIPLIERLLRDDAQVTVVYGDPRKLSPELTKMLSNVGVDSLDIADVASLTDRRADTSGRAFAAMLELTRRGFILGGKDRGGRFELLVGWDLVSPGEDTDYWALVEQLCLKETRYDVAVLASDRKTWTPTNATRTYLEITDARMEEIIALDDVLRSLSARPTGVSLGVLLSGPFVGDDGTKLDRTLDALVTVGLARRQPDGTASIVGNPITLGYLEPLWRVHTAVQAETHRRGATSISFRDLERLLGTYGIGQGKDSRAAGLVQATIKHAQASGVIDSVAVSGKRHARVVHSMLCATIERAYRTIYAEYRDRIGQALSEQDILVRMEALDESMSTPTFGYASRDRHRILRVLAQSGLIRRRDGSATILASRWGDTLAGGAK